MSRKGLKKVRLGALLGACKSNERKIRAGSAVSKMVLAEHNER